MFSLTMCFLFLPGIQREFRIFKIKPLNGAFEVPPIKKLNFQNYYNFSFQKSVEKNLEVSFGFKEPLIKIYNQYLWDFYQRYHTTQALIGEDDWFFPKWHLSAPKYSPELIEKFDQQALYLYQLSNILKEYNTQLLVCFVPSKFEIYREYVPNSVNTGEFYNFRAIDYFCDKFDASGVNYINFTKMFYDMKEHAVFNPFSQKGAHWSNIASTYAADSIFKKFAALSGINMPKLKLSEPYISKTRTPDRDLDLMFNLIRPLKSLPNYYVDVEVIEDSTTIHPKMTIIGDSHFWNVSYNVPLKQIFSEYPYWYYAKSIYFDKRYKDVDQVDIAEELISSDYILILYNAFQTYSMDSNIILEGIITLCFDKENINDVVETICNNIKSDQEWFNKVKQKAVQNNVSVEESLRNDAIYMIRRDPYKYFPQLNTLDIPTVRSKNNTVIYNSYYAKNDTCSVISEEERILQIINSMRKSEGWMNSLKEKAKTQGRSLEDVMRGDAKWVIRREEEKKQGKL